MGFFERLISAGLSAGEFHLIRFWRNWLILLLLLLLVSFGWRISFSAPADFIPGSIVIIPRGATIAETTTRLKQAHVIRHPSLLKNMLRVTGTGEKMQAGAYRFAEADNIFQVAYRLMTADYGLPPMHITFIEGMTVREMAARIEKAIPEITATDFISAGQPYEGYLFPDTYRFSLAEDAHSIVATLRANFTARIAPLTADISASGHSLSDIIIMASLIEKEANTISDKRMISGILWNRINREMLLQVDAVFGYIFSRGIYSPSFDDLTVDSPYNTYKYKGLPPGPIANPGLDSINAAIHPTETKALFYLSGRDGVLRTAVTYKQHLANQRQYLR